MTRPTVDVVIATWNGREDVLRAVESVEAQRSSASSAVSSLTVTVIDNGSTDGSAEAIRSKFPRVRILRLLTNRGFTGAVALGLSVSTADIVILLNNDAVAEPGWLEAFVDALERSGPDVVAAGGRILDSTGTLVDFYRGLMTFDGHAFQQDFRRPARTVSPPADGSEILFACGGNMAVRREAFVALGGFDDDYFAYLEDVDFGWRSWLSGKRIVFCDGAVVRHRSAATSERLGNYERGVLFERNALQTFFKNADDATLERAGAAVLLTFLHRLHWYTTRRNANASSLTLPPLGVASHSLPVPPSRAGRLRALAMRVFAGAESALIDDGLTRMQFRSLEWILRNEPGLMEKRAAVQARRAVSDSRIFEQFPLFIVPTYPGDEELMRSELFRLLMPVERARQMSLDEIMQR